MPTQSSKPAAKRPAAKAVAATPSRTRSEPAPGASRSAPRMEKADPDLLARVEALMETFPVYRRPMFGVVTWFVEENAQMLGCVWGAELNIRVGAEEAQRLVASCKARPFEMMAGRPMREYVLLPASTLRPADLKRWIARGVEFTSALERKKGK